MRVLCAIGMATLLGAGCFSPDYGSPAFACGKGGQCPYGYECGSDGLCYPEGAVPADGDLPDSGPRDGVNGPPVDAHPCDGECPPDAGTSGGDCDNERDTIVDITHSGGTYVGTTGGAMDDVTPLGNCPLYTIISTSPDIAHRFVLPGAAHVRFSLCEGADWDTVIYLKANCDDSSELACDDDYICDGMTQVVQSSIESDLPAGTYYLYVDGYSTTFGAYTLHITGLIENGAPCDPEQVSSGFLQCSNGHGCEDDGSGYACR